VACGQASINLQKSPTPPAGFSKTGKRKPGKLTLAAYPRIVNWWHPSKNGNKQPGDYMHSSKERVWLQCHGCPDCGEVHEWSPRVVDLTQFGDNFVCPYCESRGTGKFCSCRSIATSKRLAAEWHDANSPPIQVALGTEIKHKWRCSEAHCGHVWEASPRHRSSHGSNCPECSQKGNRRGKHLNLAEARPDLVPEWDEERNACPATGVTCGSNYVAWWVCKDCGGSWQARVANRATSGYGCSKCQEMYRGQPRNLLRR